MKKQAKKLFDYALGKIIFVKKNKQIDKMINIENIDSLSKATVMIAICEIMFILFTSIFKNHEIVGAEYHLIISVCVIICLLVSIFSRLYLRFHEKKKKFHNLLTSFVILLFYAIISIISIYFDILSYKNGEQMLFFYIVQFCFLLYLNIYPLHCIIAITITFGAFLYVIIKYDNGVDLNLISFFLFYLLAIFGNAIKYSTRVQKYKDAIDLQIQKEENEIVVTQSGKYITRFDLINNVLYSHKEANILFGLPIIINDPVKNLLEYEFIIPESKEAVRRFYQDMVDGVPKGSADFKIKKTDGTIIWQHGDYTLQKNENGVYSRSIISFSDVTDLMERKIIHEQRISEIIMLARDCDFYIEGGINSWVCEKMYKVSSKVKNIPSVEGKDVDEIVDNIWSHYIYKPDFPSVKEFFSKERIKSLMLNGITTDRIEFRLGFGMNDWYCIDLCLVTSDDVKETNFFVLFRDINNYHSEYSKLVDRATMDKLTGLYNRDVTMKLIEEFLQKEGMTGTHALMMVDLDNLKKINDTLGHQIGDESLRRLGECLKSIFRKTDICGRIGGDEFFVFLKNITVEKVAEKANKILDMMQMAYNINNIKVISSVSIGITIYNNGENNPKDLDNLYSEVDAALYKAKKLGKNRYSFADEITSIVASSKSYADIIKNETLSFNLRGLFDNLASGIAIFHGSLKEQMKPVFCNERLLDLLEISYDDFFNHMSQTNLYGIHPEDYEKSKQTFDEGLNSRIPIRDSYRLKKGNGDYCYVTTFTNCRFIDDESFDCYIIYSIAKEAEQLRHLRELRYINLEKKLSNETEKNQAYILLNLSLSTCKDSYFETNLKYEANCTSTPEEFFKSIEKNIVNNNDIDKFRTIFNIEEIKKESDNGNFVYELKFLCYEHKNERRWYKMIGEVALNPDSSDLELFITLKKIDKDVRFNQVVNQMLKREYEFIAMIDVNSGLITTLGNGIGNEYMHGNFEDYRQVYKEWIREIISIEFVDDAYDVLSIDHVISKLEDTNEYSCTYPTILDDGEKKKICQWRYQYIDEDRGTILIVRTNISKLIDYGFDSVTGMYGRKGFYQRAKETLSQNLTKEYYMLEIDFENFKFLNEKIGFIEGNRFLRKFGTDLRQKIKLYGKGCYTGHLEADRFIVLLSCVNNITPYDVYDDINNQIKRYPKQYWLKFRIGVYKIEDHLQDIEVMADCAHLALKSCKGRFDQRIAFYTSDLKDKMLDEQIIASEMQKALEEKQFELWFQPQVNHSANGTLVGAEVLVRWRHPTKGMISPGTFIPVFEKNGFIYELDKYIWRSSCELIRKWLDNGITPVPLSINVSRIDILQTTFLSVIEEIVNEYNIPLDLIHLEVTESAFTDDALKVVDVVNKLISKGFIVAIDDFGSGYSSLSLLRSVNAKIIKLDMSFFDDRENTTRNECIIESIIRMTKMIGMAVLAEGVEKIEQANFLSSVGCNYVQGYLYSKPLNYDDYMDYIDKNKENANQVLTSNNEIEIKEDDKSNLFFKNIISESNDIIVVSDLKTKQVLYANKEAERFYDKKFDPMTFMPCHEFCNHDHKCTNCPADSMNYGEHKEFTNISNSRHMKVHYIRLEWNGHDAFAFYGYDITNEMKEKEYINNLILNIPGALVVFGKDEMDNPYIDYISEQASRLFDIESNGTLPTFSKCLSIISDVDMPRISSLISRLIKKNESINGEFKTSDLFGENRWIDFMINPVKDKEGKYKYYGIYSDITARKNSEEKLNNIIQKIPTAMAIYGLDDDGMKRVFISNDAKKLLNSSESNYDVVSMDTVYSRIHESDRARVEQVTKECIASRKSISIKFRLNVDNSDYKWVQLDSAPIEINEKECYYYSVYTDISIFQEAKKEKHEKKIIINSFQSFNEGLEEALRKQTSEETINHIIAYIGRIVKGDRAYIIEKNDDGTDTNTFEWVNDGIIPQIDNLKNLPEEIAQPWYKQFKESGVFIISDIEDIKNDNPVIYDILLPQNIKSLVVAPFYNNSKEPIGFFGIDNPDKKIIKNNTALIQTVAFFVEMALKKRDLEEK